ncbi:hypothetical protein GGR53DRAFT_289281 [Hypoxylon sp. FL1150]|nr:hypothetical protein GGR53DRAFT_289281 [Hypoxylon sp. FL1150]
MSVELGLAIVATVDLCLKYGKELSRICHALRNSESEIEERTLRLENGWHRCTTQLHFLKSVHHTMDDNHRRLHERTLHILVGKLDVATSILRSLVKAHTSDSGNDVIFVPRPIKYVFKKERLDEAIESLELWQRQFDPSWFLILKMNDERVDSLLETNREAGISLLSTSAIRLGSRENALSTRGSPGLSLPRKALQRMEIQEIPFSNARIARNTNSDQMTTYILDRISSPSPSFNDTTKRNIRDLARRLQHDEPRTFGLLDCKGFVVDMGDTYTTGSRAEAEFTIVFRMPLGLTRPRSLRDYLLNAGIPSSLSQRFAMAQQLAKSVAYVHVFGFVHKNIRPETVLGFEGGGADFPTIFLVGFENFRKEEGRTQRWGDDTVERNLYRHPTRQSINPENDFIMQHDIYSLGVCLLEIGLWRSLVSYDTQHEHPILSDLLGLPPDAPRERVTEFLLLSSKHRLIELARGQLRERMGTRYSNIVETCLTCLDPDNGDFGDASEFEDEDGIRVGVRYIEKVLQRLNSLCV